MTDVDAARLWRAYDALTHALAYAEGLRLAGLAETIRSALDLLEAIDAS